MSDQVIKYKVKEGLILRAIFEDESQFWRWSHWKYASDCTYYDTFKEASAAVISSLEYTSDKYYKEMRALSEKIDALSQDKLKVKSLKESSCKDNRHSHMSCQPSHEFRKY